MVHTSLDVVDEKISAMGKALVDQRELYLGLLYPTEDYKVYGYVTNSKVKFVMVVDSSNTALRDNEIRSMFRKLHNSYTDVMCNPFYNPGDRIQSRWALLPVSASSPGGLYSRVRSSPGGPYFLCPHPVQVGPTSCVRSSPGGPYFLCPIQSRWALLLCPIQSRWALLSVSCFLLSVGPALPFWLPKCNHLENKGGKVFLSYEHHPPKTPRAEVLKPQSPVSPHQLLHRSPARKVDGVCVVRGAELARLASQVCPVGTWGTCRTQGQAHGQWLSGITHPLVTT
ncbi:trafficking protein particle complex subunit 2-like protein isoform X3 [Macaca nemestrina]